MNSLNSVLLEGKIIEVSENKDKDVVFKLLSTKRYKVDEDIIEDKLYTTARVPYDEFSSGNAERIKKNIHVRIVGRLSNFNDSSETTAYGVTAEHVEVKDW